MPAVLLALALLIMSAAPMEQRVLLRTIVVRGTVTDTASGRPLREVSIGVLPRAGSPMIGVRTDSNGTYRLGTTIDDTTTQIVVRARYIGYSAKDVTMRVTGDTLTANFALKSAPISLEQIVVTAQEAAVDRRTLGSSVSSLTRTGAANGQTTIATRGVTPATSKVGDGTRLRRTSAGAIADHWNTEAYARVEDNRFLSTRSAPVSTFSVDVDRASYTNVRRFINSGALPPKDAVRIEELINYFPYEYTEPRGRHPVSITTDVAPAPWNPTHRVVRIGLQTQRIRTEKLPPSNLVFLLDVSGSMMPANKLPLVKQAFRLLLNELREQDRVAIVVYAGAAGLVLPSTPAHEKERILESLDQLQAGGSTAGGAGLQLAYDVARQNFIKDGNNRVILATDGDFNVGVSSDADMERLVEARRAEGTYLTVLGFGMGNYKDSKLEKLADKGNGNYAYIDDLLEAKKVFVHEFGATLVTVAKDVKLQIEFNPAMVQAYRLIGYENRLLRNEDFTDDTKDAGDMGAGHSVTALYDVVPAGAQLDVAIGSTGALRYQAPAGASAASRNRELLFVNVRYKPPTDSVSRLLQQPVFDRRGGVSDDFRFVLAVAGYGMLLRDSEFKGRISYDDVIALARDGARDDRDRNGFITLVEATRRIAAGVASSSSRQP